MSQFEREPEHDKKPDLTITNAAVRIRWYARHTNRLQRWLLRIMLGIVIEERTLEAPEVDRLVEVNAQLAAENAALQQLAEAAQDDLTRHMHGKVDACKICWYAKCKGNAMPCIACVARDAWEWGKAIKTQTKEEGK